MPAAHRHHLTTHNARDDWQEEEAHRRESKEVAARQAAARVEAAERERVDRERAVQESEERERMRQQQEWEQQRNEALQRQRREQEAAEQQQQRENAVRQQQQRLLQEAERRRQEALDREQARDRERLSQQQQQQQLERQEEELLQREQLLQQPAMPSRPSAGSHGRRAPSTGGSMAGAPISASLAELEGRQDDGGRHHGGLAMAAPPSAPPSAAAPMSLSFAELQGRQGEAPTSAHVSVQPPSSRVSAAPISMSMQELNQRHLPLANPPSTRGSAPSSSRHAPISASFQELQSRQGAAGGTASGGQPRSSASSAPRSHLHAPISESFQELQHRHGPGARRPDVAADDGVASSGARSHAHAPSSVSMHELQSRHAEQQHLAEDAGDASFASRNAACSHPGVEAAAGGANEERPPPASPPAEAASGGAGDGEAAGQQGNMPSMQSQIVALMRDATLSPQERQRRIQDLRQGKPPQASPPAASPPAASPPVVSPVPHDESSEETGARRTERERTAFQPESNGVEAGTRLVLPSELKKGMVKRKVQKDWGECMLTFDKIKEAVKAADGHIYERWAIEKWLSENGNRSPLTNQIIAPDLIVLTDEDEGQGARFVEAPAEAAGGGDGGGVEGRDAAGHERRGVGKLVLNDFVSEEERKKRAAEKRASYMETQMKAQRDEEEAEAARLESERIEKLKRRGFAGYSPPTQGSGASGGDAARSPSSGAASDGNTPDRAATEGAGPGSSAAPDFDLSVFSVAGGIHPENLVGIAEKVLGSAADGKKGEEGVGGLRGGVGKLASVLGGGGNKAGSTGDAVAQAGVAERAAALTRKKEEEAKSAEARKRDEEAWGDRMPPPNKVIEAAFKQAMPSAEDLFGARCVPQQAAGVADSKSGDCPAAASSFSDMQEVTASGRIVDMDPRALELVKIAHAFEQRPLSRDVSAEPAASCSQGTSVGRGSAAAPQPPVVSGGEPSPLLGGGGGAGRAGAVGIKSAALQNILKGNGGRGIGGGAAQAGGSAPKAVQGAPAAPASTAPTGFVGGGPLGALLANASKKASPGPAAPPVVLWGRPGASPAGSAGTTGSSRAGQGSPPGAAHKSEDTAVAQSGDGGRGGRRDAGGTVGAGRAVRAHAHASDLLGSIQPLAPASDLLGARLPPAAGGAAAARTRQGSLSETLHDSASAGDARRPQGATASIKAQLGAVPPAAPLSVTDATAITKLSDTPGWGAYAGSDKKKVVERRKAVVEKHAGMFTLVGDLFFGARGSWRGRDGDQAACSHESASSGSEEDAQRTPRKRREPPVPPSPSSSAHLRQLLVQTSPAQGVTADGDGDGGGAGDTKTAGPLTLMGSWMPSITTWEWNAQAPDDAEHPEPDESLPSDLGSPAAASGSASPLQEAAAQEPPPQPPESSAGFALHGLGARMWKVRRRTIPIKPMTSDERELYEQGKLGVEQFVIEEEEEDQSHSAEPVPAPPSLDKILSRQAFESTLGESQGGGAAHGTSHALPPAGQPSVSPSQVAAVFDQLGASPESPSVPSMPGTLRPPPSDAEKLDMMRIFAEAEGSDGGGAMGTSQAREPLASLDLDEDADLTRLSDEELFRQLQAAQERLVGGVPESAGGASVGAEGSGNGVAANSRLQSGVRVGDPSSDGWREDAELRAELYEAEEKLKAQERALEEARARAVQEEELVKREQLRLAAMAEQERKRKRMLAEQQEAQRKALELESQRLALEQQVTPCASCLEAHAPLHTCCAHACQPCLAAASPVCTGVFWRGG